MRDAKLIETGEMDPKQVDAARRIRAVTESGVASVMASYGELGVIKDGVDLRRIKGADRPRLMAGGHRLEAAIRLGIMIPYKLWDCTNDWAELCELDDNIAGAELNPLENAVFLARRKAVYERLHPETVRGGAGAAARWNATDSKSVASFVSATAEKFGMSERQVFRIVRAGGALSDDDLALLRAAPEQVRLSDLQAIAKVTEPEARSAVCTALAEGKAKTAAQAIRLQGRVQPAIKDPVDEAFLKLRTVWSRAPKAAKRRFIDADRREIGDILEDVLEARLRDEIEGNDA